MKKKKLDFTKCAHEATRLNGNKWVVRPVNQLGTIGSYPYLWEAVFVSADSAKDALRKAQDASKEEP